MWGWVSIPLKTSYIYVYMTNGKHTHTHTYSTHTHTHTHTLMHVHMWIKNVMAFYFSLKIILKCQCHLFAVCTPLQYCSFFKLMCLRAGIRDGLTQGSWLDLFTQTICFTARQLGQPLISSDFCLVTMETPAHRTPNNTMAKNVQKKKHIMRTDNEFLLSSSNIIFNCYIINTV